MAVVEPVFQALNRADVRYVVVGGLAVVLHGHARLTVDVDLIVDLRQDQAAKAIDALVGLGLKPRAPVNPRDFAVASIRESWRRDRGMQVFSMYDPANPLRVVDLFVSHPLPFEDLWSRAVVVSLQDTSVRVASIPDLIHLKRQSGRPLDKEDIRRLEGILRTRRSEKKERKDRKRTDG